MQLYILPVLSNYKDSKKKQTVYSFSLTPHRNTH